MECSTYQLFNCFNFVKCSTFSTRYKSTFLQSQNEKLNSWKLENESDNKSKCWNTTEFEKWTVEQQKKEMTYNEWNKEQTKGKTNK